MPASAAPPAEARVGPHRRRRVGILGGSFNPVHVGHLALGRAAVQALQLDQLRFVPTGLSWQKTGAPGSPMTPARHRLAMLRIAIEGSAAHDTRFCVDPVETLREGPSYTVDTLHELRQVTGSDAALVLILGSDQLHNLPSWHRWQELPALAHIAVTQRETVLLSDLPEAVEALLRTHGRDALSDAPAGSIVRFRMPPLAASGTGIRRAIAAGNTELIAPLLPAGVPAYIEAHGLYRHAGS